MARTRPSIAFAVCVLTDEQGLSGATTAPARRGVLAAQALTNLKAQTLRVTGHGRVADAVVSVNTLAQRSCGLVIAVGNSETAAVWQQASVFPRQWFLVVGAGQSSAANVAVITGQSPDTPSQKVATVMKTQ